MSHYGFYIRHNVLVGLPGLPPTDPADHAGLPIIHGFLAERRSAIESVRY